MFFRIGSEVAKSDGIIGAKITVCGNEAISVIDPTPYPLVLKKAGSNPFFVVHDNVFKNWFAEDFAVAGQPAGSEKCVIEEYELVDEAGAPLVSDLARMTPAYNDFIHQDLLVNIENDVLVA